MEDISKYRYETKFNIASATFSDVEFQLKTHSKIFSKVYECRFVNNIYFDTPSMQNYHDNVAGVSDRVKIRIRWYGSLFGLVERPILEIKIKKGGVGRKVSMPISEFVFDKNTSLGYIEGILNKSAIPDDIRKKIRYTRPTLVNRYRRMYYLSSNKMFRATVDNFQQFYKFSYGCNNFLSSIRINNIVLEVKYDYQNQKMAPSVISEFLFRVTKNSKYVNGIELINQVHS
jgi:SPX domain protein involved in polyphosphate accumulation